MSLELPLQICIYFILNKSIWSILRFYFCRFHGEHVVTCALYKERLILAYYYGKSLDSIVHVHSIWLATSNSDILLNI